MQGVDYIKKVDQQLNSYVVRIWSLVQSWRGISIELFIIPAHARFESKWKDLSSGIKFFDLFFSKPCLLDLLYGSLKSAVGRRS